jgi:hypothetical protein
MALNPALRALVAAAAARSTSDLADVVSFRQREGAQGGNAAAFDSTVHGLQARLWLAYRSPGAEPRFGIRAATQPVA